MRQGLSSGVGQSLDGVALQLFGQLWSRFGKGMGHALGQDVNDDWNIFQAKGLGKGESMPAINEQDLSAVIHGDFNIVPLWF